jgi:hypothetical protein
MAGTHAPAPGKFLTLRRGGEVSIVGYFEVPNKSTHIRNAITAIPDTITRSAKVPIAMPIQ